MKRVAIIGCGALGTTLMRILKERLSDRYALCGVMAAHMEHAQEAAARWGCHAYGSVQALAEDRPDIAVELAGADAVRGHAETILRAGGDCGVPEKCECRDWRCWTSWTVRSASFDGRRCPLRREQSGKGRQAKPGIRNRGRQAFGLKAPVLR